LSPIVRKTHGQLTNAAAARNIRSKACKPHDAGKGAYIDDPAVVTGNHPAGNLLSNKKASPQIRIEYEIPVLPCDIQRRLPSIAPSIVYEDIEAAERLMCCINHSLDTAKVAHIKFQRDNLSTEGSDLVLHGSKTLSIATGNHEISSGPSKGERELLSQPPARAGNERSLPREIKDVHGHMFLPSIFALDGFFVQLRN
jgi:hypothetical protein